VISVVDQKINKCSSAAALPLWGLRGSNAFPVSKNFIHLKRASSSHQKSGLTAEITEATENQQNVHPNVISARSMITLNFVDYRVMSVCSHKRKHARLICLCTGLVLALWLFLGWLAEPPLRCVRGLAPDPTMYYAEVYRLAASFEQLHRSTALELSNKGFVQEWSHQSPGGRGVGYQKGDSAEEVYLIERAAATGNVEIWFKKDGRPPRLWEYLGLLKGRTINRSAFNSCIATLKQIEGAKANWAMEGGKSTNDTPRDADLFGPQAYIRNAPVCPAGGIYTIGTVAEPPRCTFTNHYLP